MKDRTGKVFLNYESNWIDLRRNERTEHVFHRIEGRFHCIFANVTYYFEAFLPYCFEHKLLLYVFK